MTHTIQKIRLDNSGDTPKLVLITRNSRGQIGRRGFPMRKEESVEDAIKRLYSERGVSETRGNATDQ